MANRFMAVSRCITKYLLLLLAVALCSSMASAQVAPASEFQLDGTAALNAAYPACNYGSPCDYWNLLNGTGALSGNNLDGSAGHSAVRTFINGSSSTLSFTGGGSKDSNPLSQWSYSSGPTPNKDTFNHGYAAGYIASGDLVLTFGADRASTNGDANIGIWFFQQNVAPNGSGGFTGAHVNHDVFIVSAFTGGGSVPNFTVYEWNTSCSASHYGTPTTFPNCAATNLNELYNATSVCGSNPTCAATNQATISTSWGGSMLAQAFFSGGLDISYIFQKAGIASTPCFSSFLEETRSSQSVTAVLKDFLGGGFPVCGLSISKSCPAGTIDPTGTFANFDPGGTVTNTGVGTLYNVQVSDVVTYGLGSSHNSGSPLAASVVNTTAGSPNVGSSTLGAGESGTWNTPETSTQSTQDVATASGSTSSGAGGTIVTSSPSNLIMCSFEAQSSLKVTKSCSTTLVATSTDVQVDVAYNGTVCNVGQSQITGLALVDYTGSAETAQSGGTGPTLASTTLAPCTSVVTDGSGNPITCNAPAAACTTFSGSYIPKTIDATATAGRYFFNDKVVVTSATATVGTLKKTTDPDPVCNNEFGCSPVASCPICDQNECVQ